MGVLWREYLRRLKMPWIFGGLMLAVACPITCFGMLTYIESENVERVRDFDWLMLVLFPLSAAAMFIAGLCWVRAAGPRWTRTTCARCGYDLRMHRASDVCPECGQSDPMKHRPGPFLAFGLVFPGALMMLMAIPIVLFGLLVYELWDAGV